jgi:Na+/glutamate symporter
MCGMSSYNEESGIIGEIITGFQKKKTEKAQQQTEVLKGLMEVQAQKQKMAQEKEANKAKMIRTVLIAFVVLVVLVTIIVGIVILRKKKLENK